jgi:hypothetical protein
MAWKHRPRSEHSVSQLHDTHALSHGGAMLWAAQRICHQHAYRPLEEHDKQLQFVTGGTQENGLHGE